MNGLPSVARDQIGTIGFCWGGGQSFRYATNNPKLRAAVVAYGPAPDTADMKRIQAPVLGIYGENDERINANLPMVTAAMQSAGKTFTSEVYPGTGHGFLKPGRQGYDTPAAGEGVGADPRVLSGAAREVIASREARERTGFAPPCVTLFLGSRLRFCMLPFLLCPSITALAPWAAPVGAVHDALHYDITLVPSDTGTHVLGEVQTTWRLGSTEPVTMQLDSAMRVIRVLVDGKPNTRISRTMYGRSSTEIDVPHQKQPGDTRQHPGALSRLHP